MDRAMCVLLIEDNEGDRRLVAEDLSDTGLSLQLHCVDSGEDGLRFLRREGRYPDAPAPDLVLLDLRLPGMDGHAVLREMRDDERLSRIPVVVLTDGAADREMLEALGLGAHEFVTKPLGGKRFSALLQTVTCFG